MLHILPKTIVDVLLSGRKNKIDVIGHAAAKYIPEGSPWHNLDHLSFARAENVKNVLQEYGIEDNVFRLQAVGMREPLRPALPTSEYEETLRKGYRDFDLDEMILEAALRAARTGNR